MRTRVIGLHGTTPTPRVTFPPRLASPPPRARARVACVPFVTSSFRRIGRIGAALAQDKQWNCFRRTHKRTCLKYRKMSTAFRPTFRTVYVCAYYDRNNMCTFVYIWICGCAYVHVYVAFGLSARFEETTIIPCSLSPPPPPHRPARPPFLIPASCSSSHAHPKHTQTHTHTQTYTHTHARRFFGIIKLRCKQSARCDSELGALRIMLCCACRARAGRQAIEYTYASRARVRVRPRRLCCERSINVWRVYSTQQNGI